MADFAQVVPLVAVIVLLQQELDFVYVLEGAVLMTAVATVLGAEQKDDAVLEGATVAQL